jgi:precorrin-2/cobalt-factor-2 C20-methyltransferase
MRFLMTEDSIVRDAEIRRQLVEMTDVWREAQTIAMPVIGDSALYASIAYLYSVLRELCPGLELKLLPGVSAHSLSSSLAGEFLALGAERFSVLPGTAGFHKLAETMLASDCVAIYKPSALGKDLPRLVNSTGPWGRAVRVHRAGLPGELILSGEEAVAPTDEYLSILLLWRERK